MIYESHLGLVKNAVMSQMDVLCSISIAEDIAKQFGFGASLESVLRQLQAAKKSIDRFKSIDANDDEPISVDKLMNRDYVYVVFNDERYNDARCLCTLDHKYKDSGDNYCIFTNVCDGLVTTINACDCEIYSISQ